MNTMLRYRIIILFLSFYNTVVSANIHDVPLDIQKIQNVDQKNMKEILNFYHKKIEIVKYGSKREIEAVIKDIIKDCFIKTYVFTELSLLVKQDIELLQNYVQYKSVFKKNSFSFYDLIWPMACSGVTIISAKYMYNAYQKNSALTTWNTFIHNHPEFSFYKGSYIFKPNLDEQLYHLAEYTYKEKSNELMYKTLTRWITTLLALYTIYSFLNIKSSMEKIKKLEYLSTRLQEELDISSAELSKKNTI